MTGLDRNQTPKTRPMPKRTALAASLESRIRLQYVTVNTTALKNRNRQGSAQVEYLGCIRGMRPSRAVIPVERE